MPPMASNTDLSSRRWLILLSSVVSFFAIGATFFVVPPLIPELVSRFGMSHLRVGLLMGAISVPAVLLAIPVGLAVDRWPARKAGVASLGLMVVGAVVFATAPTFGALFAGRLVFGVGGLVVNLLLARLIATAFADRELALAMGIFMATYPASMIAVYSFHPTLLAALGWRGELLVLAGLAAAAVPLYLASVPRAEGSPARSETPRPSSVAVGRPLAALGGAWMLFFFVHASVLTFAPEWVGGGAAALLTVTIVMWVAMVGSPVVGVLIDRTSHPTRWLIGGLAVQAGTLAAMVLGVIPSTPAMLGVGLAAALVPTAVYALPSLLVEPERVGFAFGTITAFSNLGTIAGPAAAGALLDSTGSWSTVWAMLAAVAVVALVSASRARPAAEDLP